jgi:glucose-1-phosphate thymidylyltransferase
MKGIILAGGLGTRLMPLTKATNKHLLPVGDKPMVLHPVEKLVEAGVTEILLVSGPEHMGAFVTLLGSGKDFGCQVTYRVQDVPGGIAQALRLAKGFVGDDCMTVILGDNMFEDSLQGPVNEFNQNPTGAMVLLKEVPDPHRFGIAEIVDGTILSIEEKPAEPKSNYCVTGIYLYDATVFELIETVRPSARGEMEISDVNAAYLSKAELRHQFIQGWWSDAGTFESLRHANDLIRES